MGIIRKTASISTLGIVNFRSKKELLRRAEKQRRSAEAELTREQTARGEADRRVAEAERRMQLAELTAQREAKAAAKTGKPSRRQRRRQRGEDTAKEAGRRARKAAKRARKVAASTRQRAESLKDDVIDTTTSVVADLRERAEEVVSRD